MKLQTLRTSFLLAAIVIPLNYSDRWQQVYFSRPANQFTHNSKGLTIAVRESSSPLFFPLGHTREVNSITCGGQWEGTINLKSAKEGEKGGDDFLLRIGLVLDGRIALSWFDKIFAPSWINDVLRISPNQSFEKVAFFNIAQTLDVGFFRIHPSSKLIEETVILRLTQPGLFTIQYQLEKPVKTFALWLQADGDDTKSNFDIAIHRLELGTLN